MNLSDKQYTEIVAELRNWGRVLRHDLDQHGPGLEPPITSKDYQAPNKADPDRPLRADHEWAERVEQSVRRVPDGFDTVLRNMYVHQLLIYDRQTVNAAHWRYWLHRF